MNAIPTTQAISRLTRWLSVGCCALLLSGCGALFNVAPLPKSPPGNLATETAPGGLEIGAALLLNEERSFAQFDANLPLAGVIAVEAQLTNRAGAPVEARRLKFEVRDSAGRKYKQLKPKQALERLMKFYGKSNYLKASYREARESFEAIALPLDAPLAPREERRGFLFFEAKRDVAELSGLTLSVKGGPSPLTVSLN
jgi:hypothetical protein